MILLMTVAKVTALLAVVALATLLLRRHSATVRHLLWSLAIAGLVVLPLPAAFAPMRLEILPPVGTIASSVDVSARRASGSPSATPTTEHANVPAGLDAPAAAHQEEAGSDATSSDGSRPGMNQILLALWLLGVALLLLRFTMGHVAVRGIVRRAREVTDERWLQVADRAARDFGVRAPVALRLSDAVAMPFAFGLFRPTIVLPAASAEWDAERREAVLMHEYAHISRGDLAMNMLSHVARAVYWFHPLAWLASYRLRVEGERACDDAVLRAGARPSDYAEHLLSIVRTVGATVPGAALAMARRSDFEGRLLAILEPGVPRGALSRWRATATAALFLLAVMPLAAMAPASVAPASVTTVSVAMGQESPPPAEKSEVPSSNGAVDALIETLTDANAVVRLAAVNSLGSLENPRAIAALAKALKDDADPRVREAAAWALGQIDDSRAVPHLVEALRTERVSGVREKIVEALGEIDDPSAMAGIAAANKDPSVAVRRAVASALGELEDPAAVPALLAMTRDEDVEVRKQVAQALGNLENAAAFDALTTLARDANAEVRSIAVNALGSLEDPRSLATLLAALKDTDAEVRSHAADAIHNIPDIKTAPRALIDALTDANREVRKNVAHALGSIGDEAAVPGLKRLTADTDVEVRRQAAEALSEIGGAEAITTLMGLLKDQDPEIRKIAAEALGKRR